MKSYKKLLNSKNGYLIYQKSIRWLIIKFVCSFLPATTYVYFFPGSWITLLGKSSFLILHTLQDDISDSELAIISFIIILFAVIWGTGVEGSKVSFENVTVPQSVKTVTLPPVYDIPVSYTVECEKVKHIVEIEELSEVELERLLKLEYQCGIDDFRDPLEEKRTYASDYKGEHKEKLENAYEKGKLWAKNNSI